MKKIEKVIAREVVFRFPKFWKWVQRVPAIATFFNRIAIGLVACSAQARPHPFSLWSPAKTDSGPPSNYTSWVGLVDRSFTGRHLPPADPAFIDKLPPIEEVSKLFHRAKFVPCHRTSALFCFFAQWFTDSFLRTDRTDSRRNTSNHEIDLCQIYGLSPLSTTLLRSHKDGKLVTSPRQTGDFPARIFDSSGIVHGFQGLPYAAGLEPALQSLIRPQLWPSRKPYIYATGLEHGSSTILYAAISTIFIREHNKLCDEIKKRHNDWDDDRLFETARNVNITQLLAVIVEDYINHLGGTHFKLFMDREWAERQDWYRTNRIAIEFNLLYRWHSLVPDTLDIAGATLGHDEFRFNNELLERKGAGRLITDASRQPAGRLGLGNTPDFLAPIESRSILMGRKHRLQSFNAYRERFGMKPYSTIEGLVGGENKTLVQTLSELYQNDVNKVELVVGLLAEDRGPVRVLPQLMATMVGADAFTQALTNPLLSRNIFGGGTFSEVGLEIIGKTHSFDEIVKRNAEQPNACSASFNYNEKEP